MKTPRPAAFTLIELLITTAISSVLGLIIYNIASEGLVDFARNVSINRSYSNARQAMDRIGTTMQTAGHTPLLIDATGAATTASPAAGIRFWRYTSSPLYYITTPVLTDTSIKVSLIKPGTTSTALPAPALGDLITIAAIGFQAPVTGVSTSGTTATVSFSGTLVSNTNPTLTAAALTVATTAATSSAGGKMSCLDWSSAAFIAVGTQLRYYPTFISGTTSVSTPANYKVLTYLTAALGTTTTPLPFSLGPTPSINVDLYAEAPDYNNRNPPVSGATVGTTNGSTAVGSANSYTFFQSALAPRNPTLLRSPF